MNGPTHIPAPQYGHQHGTSASAFADAFATTAGLLVLADLLGEPGRRRALQLGALHKEHQL